MEVFSIRFRAFQVTELVYIYLLFFFGGGGGRGVANFQFFCGVCLFLSKE